MMLSTTAATAATTQKHHHRGCRTSACDRHIDRVWAKKHRPKFRITPEELCVANHESGAGGPTTTPSNARFDTIVWSYDDRGYEGGFNWLHSTWTNMRPSGFATYAKDASPREQVLVFRAHKYDAGQWPPSELSECGL